VPGQLAGVRMYRTSASEPEQYRQQLLPTQLVVDAPCQLRLRRTAARLRVATVRRSACRPRLVTDSVSVS
jgi:hypothetical protein